MHACVDLLYIWFPKPLLLRVKNDITVQAVVHVSLCITRTVYVGKQILYFKQCHMPDGFHLHTVVRGGGHLSIKSSLDVNS